MKRQVIWSKAALKQFTKAIEFIRQDSPQNADIIKTRIIAAVAALEDAAVEHRMDPYRLKNDGSIRYLEVLRYRVATRLRKLKLLLYRLRHTGIKPKNY